MTLRELDAHFIARTEGVHHWVDTLAEAQGMMFLCPVCFQKNNGPVGTHSIITWFWNRGVPDDLDPKPGRWNPSGTSIDDLTFIPSPLSPMTSVLLSGPGCGAHFHITNGQIT